MKDNPLETEKPLHAAAEANLEDVEALRYPTCSCGWDGPRADWDNHKTEVSRQRLDFIEAASRLLRPDRYHRERSTGTDTRALCENVAICHFVMALNQYPQAEEDLMLVRSICGRVWCGDGCTGLEEDDHQLDSSATYGKAH